MILGFLIAFLVAAVVLAVCDDDVDGDEIHP